MFEFELTEECSEKVKELNKLFEDLNFEDEDILANLINLIERRTYITIRETNTLEEFVDELLTYFKDYSNETIKYRQINFKDIVIVNDYFDYDEYLEVLLDDIIEPLKSLKETISQLIGSKDESLIDEFYMFSYRKFQKERFFYSMGSLDIEKLFGKEKYIDFTLFSYGRSKYYTMYYDD